MQASVLSRIVLGAAVISGPVVSRSASVDYPLQLGTTWTYHMVQEVAPGVDLPPDVAATAHGNRAELTIVSRVVGRDRIGGSEYARVESTRNGRVYLTEWYAVRDDGLYLGKTADGDAGAENVMDPPQRVLNRKPRRGESWVWRPGAQPVVAKTQVRGVEHVDTSRGSFDATLVETELRVGEPPQQVQGRLRRWFVPGTGFVRFEQQSALAGHVLTRGTMTLERFEAGH
jgi:hypothetical protein